MNRRKFLSLAAGAAAVTSNPLLAASQATDLAPDVSPPSRRIRAVVFDGFAVFDPRPIAALTEQLFPSQGSELVALWRSRQFEYTWLRTIGRKYVDFWQVTEQALIFACSSLKLDLTRASRERLMQSYLALNAWPEAASVLRSLSAGGLRLAFLSNFTAAMLDQSVKNAALEGIFAPHLSTDRVRAFKPDPRAYEMATHAFHLHKEEIAFAAFAGWDAMGAKWFGYPTFWVNRAHASDEELGAVADGAGNDLHALAAFLESRQATVSGQAVGRSKPPR